MTIQVWNRSKCIWQSRNVGLNPCRGKYFILCTDIAYRVDRHLKIESIDLFTMCCILSKSVSKFRFKNCNKKCV